VTFDRESTERSTFFQEIPMAIAFLRILLEAPEHFGVKSRRR
jgi:hypothetical protein